MGIPRLWNSGVIGSSVAMRITCRERLRSWCKRQLRCGLEELSRGLVSVATDKGGTEKPAPQGRKSLLQRWVEWEKLTSPFRDGTRFLAGIGVLRLLAALVAQDDTAEETLR